MGWLITEWLILCVVTGLFGLALSVVILTVRDVVNDRRSIALHQDGSHSDKTGVTAEQMLGNMQVNNNAMMQANTALSANSMSRPVQTNCRPTGIGGYGGGYSCSSY